MVNSLDPMSMNMQALDPFGMIGQGSLQNFMNLTKADNNRMTRSVQRAERGDVFLGASKGDAVSRDKQLKLFESNQGKAAGQSSHVGPPSSQYSQAVEKAGNFNYQPIGKDGKVHFIDDSSGKPVRGSMSKSEFGKWINNKQAEDPEGAAKFIQGNGLIQSKSGEWLVPVQQNQVALQQALPGAAGQNPISANIFNSVGRTGWGNSMLGALGGGALGGAVGGGTGMLFGGLLGGVAMKKASGASSILKSPGFSGMGGMGMAGMTGMLGGSMGTAFAAVDGAAYHMKMQMRGAADIIGDQQLIATINNPGIPIEDLIFMFMARMGDKYERKLRDKMEEAARAEQSQSMDDMQRRGIERRAAMVQATSAAVGAGAGILGGVANMMTGGAISQTAMAVGQMAAGTIRAKGEANIMMRNALRGKTKSSTMLMQEVQMLTHKWKQLNELMSNLMKTMHDMAMTPIRNLR